VKVEEFVKKMYEKAKVALRKLQKEMKKNVNRIRKKAMEYKVEDRVLLSTKDLV